MLACFFVPVPKAEIVQFRNKIIFPVLCCALKSRKYNFYTVKVKLSYADSCASIM